MELDNFDSAAVRLGLKENWLGRKTNFRTKCSIRIKIARSQWIMAVEEQQGDGGKN